MDFDGGGGMPRTAPVTGPPTGRVADGSAREPSGDGSKVGGVAEGKLRPMVAPPIPAPARNVPLRTTPLSHASADQVPAAAEIGVLASSERRPLAAVMNADAGLGRVVAGIASARSDRPRRGGVSAFMLRWLRRLTLLVAAFLLVTFGLMGIYRVVDPPATPVMAVRALLGEPVGQRWVSLDQISPHLVRAVVASEDARFCAHAGVDLGELKAAIDDTLNGRPRGGSTITMQVVKNLFLWPSRSVIRKAIEIPLAFVLDFLWPKRRILEVYLNIAEWGPGLYGAEAAARSVFGKPALRLSPGEAQRLAVSLPNPLERDAGDPDRMMERLAGRLAQRVRSGVALGCLR